MFGYVLNHLPWVLSIIVLLLPTEIYESMNKEMIIEARELERMRESRIG